MAEDENMVEDIEPYGHKLRQIVAEGFRLCSDPSQVLEHLFIGSSDNATDPTLLHSLTITHVINTVESYVSTGSDFYGSHISYMGFTSEDTDDYDILQHFDDVNDFIENARKNGGKTLIHCQSGANRSGALAIAYIMVYKHMGPLSVTRMVKKVRPLMLENEHFQWLLLKFANEKGLLVLDKDEID